MRENFCNFHTEAFVMEYLCFHVFFLTFRVKNSHSADSNISEPWFSSCTCSRWSRSSPKATKFGGNMYFVSNCPRRIVDKKGPLVIRTILPQLDLKRAMVSCLEILQKLECWIKNHLRYQMIVPLPTRLQ